ncbi:phage tail protein [Brevibacillus fulvus]|uniref:Microcystin-dependent protein n=1 Tax=Brevibacillus fulvus TaxID=1125967 RepID=A0A939BTD9_9BACL|nr:tail fiber protein [Brevibacillus fulvus]MBM7591722.1 microcystin-dependent protein [Brevibacillus fulvus]
MEPYVGEIRMFAGNFAPVGWAICDGSLLAIAEYSELFALIGTTYGGDGQTSFALPDLRGRLPVHQGENPETQTVHLLGEMGGTEQVTLTVAQLPAHTHQPVAASPASQTSPEGAFWAAGPNFFTTEAPNAEMDPAAISSFGGNQPHDNIMPYGTVSFIIALFGIFPTTE